MKLLSEMFVIVYWNNKMVKIEEYGLVHVHVTFSDNRRTGQNKKHIEIAGYLFSIQLPIEENSFI